MSPHTDPGALLKLLQASSCFRGDVCSSLPCACAESLARQAASQDRAEGECCRAQGPDSKCFCPPHRRKALWLASTCTSHAPGTSYNGKNADNARLVVQMLIDELAALSPPSTCGEAETSSDGTACGDYSQASQRRNGDLQPVPSEAASGAAQAQTGCGDPSCKDPECTYGKGKPRCQNCGDPIAHGIYCDMCREMGCSVPSAHCEGGK